MGQLPNNDIPWNRAHLTQKQTGGKAMYISVTRVGDEIGANLITPSREEFEQDIESNDEVILCHEPMFGKAEEDYNTGEDVIVALARTAGNDDDSPGSALERLVTQTFLLGVSCGTKAERERIIARVAGE